MQPILTVEFSARAGEYDYKEESVSLHSPEELFEFVAPGGGCEKISSEVEEIRMVFLPPMHRNENNPVADAQAVLQLHMVIFTGPLSEISQTAEQIIDKAGRGELSDSFLRVLGIVPGE
ncbi:hypothetical protein [Kaarinaea lacus]